MTARRTLPALPLLAGLLMALPHAAQAAPLAGGTGAAVSPWRVVAALVLCLALGAAAILVMRRRYGAGGIAMPGRLADRRMRLIEQQALGTQRSLSLVEIEGRTFVALIAPGAAALVPLDPAAGQSAAPVAEPPAGLPIARIAR